MVTRVKICGITNLNDAKAAVNAGASALGFVFYEPSPRYVNLQTMQQICEQLPAFITPVALFVNANAEFIYQLLDAVPQATLQFHGDETAAFCESFKHPYIKALRMKEDINLHESFQSYQSAQSILLDAYRKGIPGGTGEAFDWGRIPQALAADIILAGGLDCLNVANAITTVKPYAVDVSGGVEESHGIKCHTKLTNFISEVQQADRQLANA